VRADEPADGPGVGPDRPDEPAAAAPAADAPSRRAGRARAGDDDALAVVSPRVRRLARESGVDLARVRGSGPGGLILRRDVERAASAHRTPLRGVLGAMAERLTRSHADIPRVTCWLDTDATDLVAARRATGLPLLALLARACLAALDRHPQLNASVDTAAREIVRHDAVHLGFAARTERGLLVPVLRDAHALSTRRLADELARLTQEARAGRLPPAELTGSTFTLNNYGPLGVDGATPLLNPPEAALLGVGRIGERPWAHEGRLALRQVVTLSLTFDHRVCDGATAAAFLGDVADRVRQPLLLVADR
jgi:pyruvate dehydrogenase E2 component (dihydrolipoamide acetyltransferase)